MENKNVKFKIHQEKIFYGLEKTGKINQKIYQKGKGEDSSGDFRFQKTGGRN